MMPAATTAPAALPRLASVALVVSSLVLTLGCDEGEDFRPPPSGDLGDVSFGDTGAGDAQTDVDEDASDTTTDGTADGTDQDGTDANADAETDTGLPGPTVQIVSPSAASDPNTDALVTEADIDVACEVTPGPSGAPVDPTTVVLEVEDADGEVFDAPGMAPVQPERFSSIFNLGNSINGQLTITCTASDENGGTASDEITTFLDLGPSITIESPVDDGFYANSLNVRFTVEAAPVSADDTSAAVDESSVKVFVGGTELPGLTQDADGDWVTSFEFDDGTLFNPELIGLASLRVEASNVRAPQPVTRSVEVLFTADAQDPVVEIVRPAASDLVGGIFEIEVKATDPAGIDPRSVFATVANQPALQLDAAGDDTFTGLYDVRNIDPSVVQAHLGVVARDNAGNEGSAGYGITIDTQRPLLDMDAPTVREFNIDGECSLVFDPLGYDTPDDGDAVPQLTEFRARIEDQGNGATNTGTVTRKAGVAPTTAKLFILDDENGALVVDTNGDGVCDDINPKVRPSSVGAGITPAVVADLVGIEPSGESFKPVDAGQTGNGWGDPVFGTTPWLADSTCGTDTDTTIPDEICPDSSPLIRVIKDEIDNDPVIWGLPAVTTSNCVGSAFDALGAGISDGWACVAVRAEDKVGNIGVSPPQRVCFELTGQITECQDSSNLPDCTGVYDPDSDTTDASASCALPADFESQPWRNVRRDY